MKKKKTKEVRLWDYLNKLVLGRELDSPTARRVYDYVTKYHNKRVIDHYKKITYGF